VSTAIGGLSLSVCKRRRRGRRRRRRGL